MANGELELREREIKALEGLARAADVIAISLSTISRDYAKSVDMQIKEFEILREAEKDMQNAVNEETEGRGFIGRKG